MELTVTEYKPTACPRCNGLGVISYYSHVKGGECFSCNGTGHRPLVAVSRPMTDMEVLNEIEMRGVSIVHVETVGNDATNSDFLLSLFDGPSPDDFMAGARSLLSTMLEAA